MAKRERRQLNQWAISKTLGSEMRPATHGRFGRFNLLPLIGEALSSMDDHEATDSGDVARDSFPLLVQAFAETSGGYALDPFLADPELAAKFHKRARQLGINASDAALNRRLMSIRKNPSFYGLRLPAATRDEGLPADVLKKTIIGVEFAVAKMKRLNGATVDDMLEDPALGRRFDKLCADLVPGFKPAEYRLTALYLRKTRYMKRSDESLFAKLDVSQIDAAMKSVGPLASIRVRELPKEEGIIDLVEQNRHLFVTRNDDIRATASQFKNSRLLENLGGSFWSPRRETIDVRFYVGSEFHGVKVSAWERKVIQVHQPIFNLPIEARKAA
jgi:hypothetical protein